MTGGEVIFTKVSNDDVIQGHSIRYSSDESYTKVMCLTCNKLNTICRDEYSARVLGSIHQFIEAQGISPIKVIFSWEDFKPNG